MYLILAKGSYNYMLMYVLQYSLATNESRIK